MPASQSGELQLPTLPGGAVTELTVLRLPLPPTGSNLPQELILSVEASLAFADGATRQVANTWRLLTVPDQQACLGVLANAPVVHTLNDELLAQVGDGATAMLWLVQPDECLTTHVPFWREAIHVFEPHLFWNTMPHPGYADMRFFSVATDFALAPDALTAWLNERATDVRVMPVWRRFDARKMTWADYVVEVRTGAGRLFISTLRFAGGLGYQPDTFETNPIGTWILRSLLELPREAEAQHGHTT